MTTPPREFPARPRLEQYRKQAKDLVRACADGEAEARARVAAHMPGKDDVQLSDAQFVIAREHGFENWAAFKQRVQELEERFIDPLDLFKHAINDGDAARVRRLLEAHPVVREHVNAPLFEFGTRPIIHARANRKIVDALLDHGADINLRTDWAPGPWGALDNVEPEQAEYLISRGAIVDVFAAAALGKMDRLRELLDADPSLVHAKGGDGCRPLHFARSAEVMDFLLSRGADIEARDVDHNATALQWSIPRPPGTSDLTYARKSLEASRLLVERGARLDIFAACALGDVDRLRRLIDDDPASLDARIGDRTNAACPPGEAEHIYVYTLGGGKTPHQIASEFGNDACLALLIERSTPMQRLLIACSRGDEATARALLHERPSLLSELSPDDHRLLADSAGRGELSAVRLMLDLGFPIDVKVTGGGTPLHHAAWFGHAPVVELLLERGAPVNVHDDGHHSTPLGWCCHGSKHCNNPTGNYPATAELLLRAGGTPAHNATDATDAVATVLRRYGMV